MSEAINISIKVLDNSAIEKDYVALYNGSVPLLSLGKLAKGNYTVILELSGEGIKTEELSINLLVRSKDFQIDNSVVIFGGLGIIGVAMAVIKKRQ